jgi:transposase
VGVVGKVKFEARIKELVENLPDLAELVEPLLVVRRVLREQFVIQHRRLLAIVRDDEVCQRLMTTPGVGPVVADKSGFSGEMARSLRTPERTKNTFAAVR